MRSDDRFRAKLQDWREVLISTSEAGFYRFEGHGTIVWIS
jgi:hypothetical protein